MDEFFFEPIGKIVSDFNLKQNEWENISTKREIYFRNVAFYIRGEEVSSPVILREFLVHIISQNRILDLRNLYVQKIKSSAVKLIQHEFVVEFSFNSKSDFKMFSEIAKRYWIRCDMPRVYHFDLENNSQRVGAGGFGDVRMVKHKKSKETFALKSVYKKKIKNKRSSGNSMRYY